MDNPYEHYEVDFELPAEILDRLRGLEKGAKASGRMPMLTCRDRKNRVTIRILRDSDIKKIEARMRQNNLDSFFLWLLSGRPDRRDR